MCVFDDWSKQKEMRNGLVYELTHNFCRSLYEQAETFFKFLYENGAGLGERCNGQSEVEKRINDWDIWGSLQSRKQ